MTEPQPSVLAQGAETHHAPEVFLFYRDKQLFHIHTDRKVFEQWMEKQSWQYPPDRCEIVRYSPAPATTRSDALQALADIDRDLICDRPELSYLKFRSGFPDPALRPPPWEDLPSYVRDAVTVGYLQGKLDGKQ